MNNLESGWRDDLASGSIHDLDEGTHAVAVDFPHNVMDTYRTDWATGCFDDGLNQRLPVMVFNHNKDMVIGAGVRHEPLGDKTRLIGRFADFDHVPDARMAFSLVKDSIIPGWSFHYRDGRAVKHPEVKGAYRFTKARMLEFSPVTFPSLPGANAVGIRAEEATMAIPTISEILQLKKDGLLNDEGVRSLVEEHYPNMREHIVAISGTRSEPDRVLAVLDDVNAVCAEELKDGFRAMTITVGDDGSVSADGGGVRADENAATLAQSIDAALDESDRLLDGADIEQLPDNVQQAVHLARAASVAVDELLATMGIDDPDDPVESGSRAVVEGRERDELPDSDFAYIEPGGKKDANGRTVPRSLRHFPIMDAEHVRDALARIDQGAKFGEEALPKVKAAAEKFGIKVDKADGERSELIARGLSRLGR